MQLLAPDILEEARGLPAAVSATGLGLGLALWALGWWQHRFWIVLFITLLAGTFGLAAGPVSGVQPLVVAILVSVAAGALALPLARVLAFIGSGLAAWIAVHAALPSWDEPLLCFVAGGLVGLVLFRYCTMALTSLTGTLLVAYSSLCLADRLGRLDAIDWSGKHASLLNWACLGAFLVGWVVQFLIDRRQTEREQERAEEAKQLLAKAAEAKKEAKKKEKEQAKEKAKERKNVRRKPGLWEQLGFPRQAG